VFGSAVTERSARTDLYASPRHGLNVEDCLFYHMMEIPTIGVVVGRWDLRAGAREYLGGVDVAGKRVPSSRI